MTDIADLSALFGAQDASTFLGLPQCDDLKQLEHAIALLGVPCATPYASVGAYCKHAPGALRQAIASLSANIHRYNFDIGSPIFPDEQILAADCGNLPFDEGDAPANRNRIKAAVGTILKRGAIPIVLGGDDSIPIPMLEAFAESGPCTILQIDAHIDWRDSHMDEPLGLSSTMRRASEMAHIERIVQVGARSIGSAHPDDVQDALDWGATIVPAQELHEKGVQHALQHIPRGSNIIICLDVDALDPSIVPGVIGRAPGGLSYFQTLDLIKGAAERGRIAGIDFVEFMPEVDVGGIGAMTVSRLIASTLGILSRQISRG